MMVRSIQVNRRTGFLAFFLISALGAVASDSVASFSGVVSLCFMICGLLFLSVCRSVRPDGDDRGSALQFHSSVQV